MDYDTGKTLEKIIEQNETIIQMLRTIGDMVYQQRPKKTTKKRNKNEEEDEEEPIENDDEEITNLEG